MGEQLTHLVSSTSEVVEVRDGAILIPPAPADGSTDYIGETRRFILAIFGSYPNWPERDHFLRKSQSCVDVSQFERLSYHQFLKSAKQRAFDFVNFRLMYRDVDFQRGNRTISWKEAYDEWEKAVYPNVNIDLRAGCSQNRDALAVFDIGANNDVKYLDGDNRGTKVILARDLVIDINGFSDRYYSFEERLCLIEYLLPNMGQLEYDFCWEHNLKVDILQPDRPAYSQLWF